MAGSGIWPSRKIRNDHLQKIYNCHLWKMYSPLLDMGIRLELDSPHIMTFLQHMQYNSMKHGWPRWHPCRPLPLPPLLNGAPHYRPINLFTKLIERDGGSTIYCDEACSIRYQFKIHAQCSYIIWALGLWHSCSFCTFWLASQGMVCINSYFCHSVRTKQGHGLSCDCNCLPIHSPLLRRHWCHCYLPPLQANKPVGELAGRDIDDPKCVPSALCGGMLCCKESIMQRLQVKKEQEIDILWKVFVL